MPGVLAVPARLLMFNGVIYLAGSRWTEKQKFWAPARRFAFFRA